MYKKYLELKWDRLYSTLTLEGSDLRSNRKILILKRSFHAEPKLTWKFDRQVMLVSSLKHFTWRVDTVVMVVMYFVGLPSNSDKNEKLLMSSIVEGLRLLSKMKKYRYFWTSSFKKPQKPRTEAIQEKIVKVSSLPISFNSVKDKDYNSVSRD